MRVKYNADTRLVFQIGDPIEHSTAAYLHNAMYELANLNAVCLPVRVRKGELPTFMRACRLLNADGFDITTPHKADVIPLLDECDEMSRLFGCVNHVKYRDGKWIGAGLDGVGMAAAIEEAAGSVAGTRVMILGAGAVAGPIAAELCRRGAESVFIANRTLSRAEHIAELLRGCLSVPAEAGPLEEAALRRAAPGTDLVIQCTSLELCGGGRVCTGFMELLPGHCICADVLYPRTEFLAAAEEHGLRGINGMGMLLRQQLEMMDFRFGVRLPSEVLPFAEEDLSCAVALRSLRDQRRAACKPEA